MVSPKNIKLLIFILYVLNIYVRLYGIAFPRMAWDEAQYYGGGINITTILSGLKHFEWRGCELEQFVSINGPLGKYICVLGVAVGRAFEKLFPGNYAIAPGLICARFLLAFIPNMLILYFTQKLIRLIYTGNAIVVMCLLLFLFPFTLIETSVYAVSDSLVAFLALASVYYTVRFRTADGLVKQKKYLRLTVLFICLTLSAKLSVGMAAGIGFCLVLLHDYRKKNIAPGILLDLIKFILLFMLPLIVLINFPYIMHFKIGLREIIYHIHGYAFILKGNPLTYLFMNPAMGIGWTMLIPALFGIVWILFLPERKIVLPVFGFMLVYYGFLSFSYGATHNWHIPLIPFLVMFATIFIYRLYLFLIKLIRIQFAYSIIFVVSIAIGIMPLKNLYEFKMNISEKPETLSRVEDFMKQHNAADYILIRNEKIKSVEDLRNDSAKYIVFSNDWLCPASHPYPAFLIHEENFRIRTFGTDWISIQNYVESHWKKVSIISPKHFTAWTKNTSVNAVYSIYERRE